MRTSVRVGQLGGACLLGLMLLASAPAGAAEDAWAEARKAYREGRHAVALVALERLVAQDPQDREAHYYLALVRWRLGRQRASAAAWQRVLALDPEGPFGRDARHWLASFGGGVLAGAEPPPATSAPAAGSPPGPASPLPLQPSPRATAAPTAPPTAARATTPPWLTAKAPRAGSRPRARNARPGWFKALDGTFEFVPPPGFVLLDEGDAQGERRALFAPRRALAAAGGAEQPPTLLLVWRDVPELLRFRSDQRSARARQLLLAEAVTYGPGVRLEARFGVQAAHVAQRQGSWAADTWLFFQDERLYAVTFGGEARLLSPYQAAVARSLGTLVFNR
ncbi:MAG: hypothetical protein VKQ33_08835 [Candidatus Sericytochromatia bacterium]|nr:hypothetical protein [Candidatus Sericytochromatia bacterium]